MTASNSTLEISFAMTIPEFGFPVQFQFKFLNSHAYSNFPYNDFLDCNCRDFLHCDYPQRWFPHNRITTFRTNISHFSFFFVTYSTNFRNYDFLYWNSHYSTVIIVFTFANSLDFSKFGSFRRNGRTVTLQ